MEFHVESTRIAHRLALSVSAPQSGGCGVAVGTGQSKPPGGRHALLRLDEGPAEAVHLAVEAAGVAQVMAGAVPPPERRLDGAAVHALATLWGQVLQQVCAGAPRHWERASGATLQAVQHRRLEGSRGPGGRQRRAHVGSVGARVVVVMVVVCSVQGPRGRQRAVLVLAAAHDRQAAAAAAAHAARAPAAGRRVAPRVPRRAVGHGRAGRVGEARRDVRRGRAGAPRPRGSAGRRTACAAVRGAVGRGLGPAGVRARAARVIGGPAARPLQVRQAGEHGTHAGGGHVDWGAGRRVHEASGRAVVSGRTLAGEGGEGLVHLLGLLGCEGTQLGAAAGPQQLAGGRGLVEVSEEQQILPARQGAPGASDPRGRRSVGSPEGVVRGVGTKQQRAGRGSRHRLRVELRRPAVAGAAGAALPTPGAAGGGRRGDGRRRRGGFPRWKGSGVAGVRSRGPEALRQAPAAVSQGHPQSGAAAS